jgi:hypothetical protein
MSRCYCCNNILTPREMVRKFKDSGQPTEMCDTCLGTIAEIDTEEGEADDEELFDENGDPIEDS